jgi:hypothetical protein
MQTTEMATMTTPAPSEEMATMTTPPPSDDIATILNTVDILQKKVEFLEEYIKDLKADPAPKALPPPHSADGIYVAIDGPPVKPGEAGQPGHKWPADSYSMMVLNAPPRVGDWEPRNKLFFGIGLYVALFQIITLLLLTLGCFLDGARASFGEHQPAIVRVAQVLALSFYIFFPGPSLHDFTKALRYFPIGDKAIPGDPVEFMEIACFLRGFQGLLAILPAWLLIMSSNSVVMVILSFAAINVISEFDEAAFAIARTGAFGPLYRQEVERIESLDVPCSFYQETIYFNYWVGVGTLNLVALVAMVIVWAVHDDPYY